MAGDPDPFAPAIDALNAEFATVLHHMRNVENDAVYRGHFIGAFAKLIGAYEPEEDIASALAPRSWAEAGLEK